MRSLPVPLSPVISTVPLERAMREALRSSSRVASLWPTIEGASVPTSSARRYSFSCSRRRVCSIRSMTISIVSGEQGFSRKSRAPWRMASTAASIVPCAVTRTVGRSGYSRPRVAIS